MASIPQHEPPVEQLLSIYFRQSDLREYLLTIFAEHVFHAPCSNRPVEGLEIDIKLGWGGEQELLDL